jgi:hypothetical protein
MDEKSFLSSFKGPPEQFDVNTGSRKISSQTQFESFIPWFSLVRYYVNLATIQNLLLCVLCVLSEAGGSGKKKLKPKSLNRQLNTIPYL